MMSFTGDPVFMVIPIDSTTAEIEQARRLLGLDRSLLSQYFIFLGNMLQGDFGRSYVFRQPAMDLILERLPATIEMVLVAIMLATVIAVPLGVYAGANPNKPACRGIMAGSLLGISLPGFWVGMMLIFFFSVRYQLLPSSGRGDTVEILGLRISIFTADGWSHIILPSVTLALATLAIMLRMTRAGMMEVMRQDYDLIAFATITETIFAWPGTGKLLIDSIYRGDRPVIVVYLMLTAFIFVAINFIVDIVYTLIDPRITVK
jgi:peptide/nickel transport system permease protein